MGLRRVGAFVYFAFIFLLVGFTMKTRTDLQKRRILIVSDELFYEQVVKGSSLSKTLSREGYRVDNMVIDEHDFLPAKVDEAFDRIYAKLAKENTVMLLMSPVVSCNYVQLGRKVLSDLLYSPIVVGFGSFADTSKFDFVYRLDVTHCFEYRQMFGNKVLLVYSSSDAHSQAGMKGFEKWPNDKIVDYDMLSENERQNFKDSFSEYNMVLTAGFKGLYLLLRENKLPVKVVMPYTYNLISDSDARFLGPDLEHVILNSLGRYNAQNGCVVENTSWRFY